MPRPRIAIRVVLALSWAIAGCGSGPGPSSAPPTAIAVAPPWGNDAVELRLADTNLRMSMPGDWYEMALPDLRQELEAPPIADGPVAEISRRLRDDFDNDRFRAAAAGPSGFEPWTATLAILVYEGDESLEDRVAAVEEIGVLMPPTNAERRRVQLPIRESVRLDYTYPVPEGLGPGAVPSHSVQYVVWLGDGRSLWLFATGPVAAGQFGTLIDSMVATLRAS